MARNCPQGTIGTWPDCRTPAKPKCPQGTSGKWPNCVETVKPADQACAEGQVRKGKRCVAVTQGGDSGAAKPPSTQTTKSKETIPPEIAALIAGRPHRPREVLVLLDAARASEIATRLERQYNVDADPRAILPLLDGAAVRLKFKDNRSLESLLAALSSDPDVKLSQPNYDYGVSKDSALPKSVPQYAGEKIGLEEAHRLARGKGVMVAVVDTAIEASHPELAGAIAGVFDALDGGPSQAEKHGTEIAGILAARAKLTGVAPEAALLSVRAFRGAGGKPAQSTTLQLLKGIDWAYEAGAKVVNMSFAGPKDPLLERIIKAAADKGVIFVAAAGNNGPKAPPVYPAAYPDVIAVTATDDEDKLYSKANRGNYIAIAAPGVDILAPAPKGRYEISSGTSMAAAHVSGAVALLLERDAKLNAAQVREILAATARKPDTAEQNGFGAGIIDAAKALGEDTKGEASAAPILEPAGAQGR